MMWRGANTLAYSRLIGFVAVIVGLAIATTTCSGVHADGDSDADSDADTDGDADRDADADIDGGLDDLDDDGVAFGLDCNDCNAGIGPGFPEPCGNGFDEDCTGDDLTCDPDDVDGDGFESDAAGGTDYDDSDPHTYLRAVDYCGDGIAQDCTADMPCTDDADGDHFTAEDDCDDTDPSVRPWAEEVCDPAGVDEDCDSQVNEVSVEPDRFGCIFDPAEGHWQAVDFMTDPSHCGRCRNDCVATGAGTRCTAGICE